MTWEWGVLIGAAIVFFLIKGFLDEKNRKTKLRNRVHRTFGKPVPAETSPDRFRTIDAYLKSLPERDTDLDEITWNDLDMDRMFQLLNGTFSAVGEEYLYALLHRPETDPKALSELEDRITYFTEHPDERDDFGVALSNMGKLRRISVYSYLMKLKDVSYESNFVHYSPLLLYVAGIVLMILGYIGPGLGLVICTAFYNVVTYLKRKGQIEPYLQVLAYTVRWIGSVKELANVDSHEDLTKLKELVRVFSGMERGMRLLTPVGVTGGLLDLFLDYVRMLTHVDLIKFNRMRKKLTVHENELREMFAICGRLDTAIAIASYRKSQNTWCVPELLFEEGRTYEVIGLGHPLISEPVRNDLTTEQPVLLTGSNASGKSTFLRSVALSAVMAQTVHTVNAVSYRANAFHIVSSMSLNDSLLNSESYYIVEIKSIKRILDFAGSTVPVLAFVDEVLRGTNTAERIAASTEILKYMADRRMLVFAATHDLELTGLLEKTYSDYHFSETVTDGDIRFDYTLKPGRATSKNAIALLKLLQYPEAITEPAGVRVTDFLATGEWKTEA